MNNVDLLTLFGNYLLKKYPEGKETGVSDADLRNFQVETGAPVYEPGEIP